ncbi:hypothetical protein [Nitrosomonas sp.]|uniref:hypothetical protein n=1 Tax=Nitrosomonas sp. TaxID=42353 RepID=UPI002630733A|nr:hypothetical protein [Nitrosomonas sp.]
MKKLLFVILVSMVFSNNLYAKPGKSSGSKGSFGSKPAATQQKKADTPSQAAPSPSPAAAGSNAAPAPAANAPAQSPSLMQSVMPALVGGAVGSYVGSKLADDGSSEKPVEGNEEKKEGQLKP